MDGPEHWASSSLLDRILRWYLDKIERDPGRDTCLQEMKEPFRMKELENIVAMRTEEFGTAVLSLLEQLKTERFFREKQSQDLASSIASRALMEKEGEKLKRKLKRAENRSIKYTRRLELSNTRAQELEESIKRISLGLQESKNNSHIFEMELTGLRQTASDLRAQLEEKLRDLNRIKDVNTNQYLRITKLESTLSETLSKLGSGEMAVRELSSLKNMLSHRMELNRELETTIAKQNEKMAGMESQISSLLLRVEATEQKNRGLLEENLRLKESVSGMAGFQGAGQLIELKKEVARLNDTLKSKQDKLKLMELNTSHLEQEKATLANEKASLVSEKASLVLELSSTEQTIKEMKAALESSDQYQGIDSLISYKEITEGKTGNQHKMLVALRDTLFSYSKKSNQAEQLERRVVEVNLQLEAKIVQISELENTLRNLKQREENERQRRELLSKELEQSQEARTLKEGELASLSHALSEKEKQISHLMKQEQKQASILIRLEEEKRYLTDEMTRKVETKLAQLSESEKLNAHHLQAKNSEIADLERKISDLQSSISKAIKERDLFDQQCKELREVLSKQLIKEDLLIKEVDRLEAISKTFEFERLAMSESLKEKEKRISEAKSQIDALMEKSKDLQNVLKEKSALETLSKDLKDSLQTQKRALENQQNEMKRLLATNTNLEARNKISAAELLSKDMKLGELSSQISKLRDAFDQLKNRAANEIEAKNKEVSELKALTLQSQISQKKQAAVLTALEREKSHFEDQCKQLRDALAKERSARDDQAKDPVLTRKLVAKEQKLQEVTEQLARLENKYQNIEADHFQVTQNLELKSREAIELQAQVNILAESPERHEREKIELEKKCEELKELVEQERSSREFQSNEIDTLHNTNSILESKCQELSLEVSAKDLKLDELLAQLVEVRDQALAMEEMKHKVVTMLRYASGGKMHELLHGSDEKGDSNDPEDLKQARMLISQFSAASFRPSALDKSKMIVERSSPEPLDRIEHIGDEDGKIRDTDASSVSSGDEDASSQRVFELESWAEALEEDNRSMELALISLETDMLELESHRDYLEDVIHRALNQLSKPTPGGVGRRTPDSSSSPLVEQTRLSTVDGQRPEPNKMISITISKWLGDATYR